MTSSNAHPNLTYAQRSAIFVDLQACAVHGKLTHGAIKDLAEAHSQAQWHVSRIWNKAIDDARPSNVHRVSQCDGDNDFKIGRMNKQCRRNEGEVFDSVSCV